MMYLLPKKIILPVFLLFSIAVVKAQDIPWFNNESYNYPDIHDPAVIKDERGVYIMLSTNNLLTIYQSSDLSDWNTADQIFDAVPQWATDMNNEVGDLWAPAIVYMNDRYWVYYSASSFGSNNSGIGVVSSPTLDVNDPDYGWTEHGMVIQSEGENYNAIDPDVIQDEDGNWWMVFGSHWPTGIRMVQIDPNTGMRTSGNNTIHSLANRDGGAIEGPSITYHDGYYYLFVAWDACCDGVNSTYKTMVGRSSSITGPYVDQNGDLMTDGNATLVLSAYDRYIGPGGGSVFQDGKRTYFAHHYYNEEENGMARVHFREIVWDDDGWPVVNQPFIGRRRAYEAEHAGIANVQINDGDNASDGSYVGNINDADSRVTFHVNAFQQGEYILRTRYAAGDGQAAHALSVNGQTQSVSYPGTGSWGQFPEGQTRNVSVQLDAGHNELTFSQDSGFAELDRIDLLRPATQTIEAGSYDDGLGISYQESGNNAVVDPDGWAQYEYINFADSSQPLLHVTAGGDCQGTLRFSVDARDGAIAAETTVDLAQGDSHEISLNQDFADLTGPHDLFYTFTGSESCVLDQLQFSADSLPEKDCNGDTGGTAVTDSCGICTGGNTGLQPCTGALEAETACEVDGVLLENENAGYSGDGYINTDNADSASAEWAIENDSAGMVSLSFRYANGSTSARPAQLLVDGQVVDTLNMNTTADWETWNTLPVNVNLPEGRHTLTLTAISEDGLANIDYIAFSGSVLHASCVVTGSDLADFQKNEQVVYPNPASDKVRLVNAEAWKLFTVRGQLLDTGHGQSIELEQYPQGIYIIKTRQRRLKIMKK